MNNKLKVIKPFGPTIARVKMPNELIKNLNDYVDEILSDEDKSKKTRKNVKKTTKNL